MALPPHNPRHGGFAKFDPAYLPAEIFSNIISIACQQTDQLYDNTHMFPLTLASVNQSWRSFVLDSPRIWASLCVDLRSPPPPNDVQIEMFLGRSRTLPLDIAIFRSPSPRLLEKTPEPEAPPSFVATLMQALGLQIGRWRSFKLHLNDDGALHLAISNFRGVAESLEELVLDGDNIGPSFSLPRTPAPTFRMVTPAIRHLHISGGAASWLIRGTKWITKLQGLTSLTLTGPTDDDITGAAFSTFLQDISVVSTLEVLEFNSTPIHMVMTWGLDWQLPPIEPPTPDLQLPRLKEIRFTDCITSLADELCTFYIDAPNLEILDVLTHFPRYDEAYFMQMSLPFHPGASSPRFPKLRTFRFTGPHYVGAYLAPLECCEHLIVSGIHNISGTLDRLGAFHDDMSEPASEIWDDGYEASPSIEGWFCPRLLSLEIDHCDGLSPSQLQNVLAARQGTAGPGSPINTISCLIVHDEQELPGDDRAWFESNLASFLWVRIDRPASPAPDADADFWDEIALLCAEASEKSEPVSP